MLAYLVQQGHRVTVTTHSLTILYALNNLMLGFRRNPSVLDEPGLVLNPEMVSAYHLKPEGQVVDIMDHESGFISEADLSRVDELLAAEFNALLD